MKTLTAVLFAGGESRRMGADKATLTIGSEPLWSRQLKMLRELQPGQILLSARTRPAWCPADLDVVLDETPSGGPLAGLVAALKHIRTTHLLALAVDLPRMTSAHLESLWSLARAGAGVVPRTGQFIEPLCAVYPVEALAPALVARTDASLQGLVRALAEQGRIHFHDVSASERGLYQNCNTPEDFSSLL